MADWPEERHHSTLLLLGSTLVLLAAAVAGPYYGKTTHFSWTAGLMWVAYVLVGLAGMCFAGAIRGWPVPGRKIAKPADPSPVFRYLVVTPQHALSSAQMGAPERPILPAPVTLHMRAYAAAHHDALPVRVLRAECSIVFEGGSSTPSGDARVRRVTDEFSPIEHIIDQPEVRAEETIEIECDFFTRIPESGDGPGIYLVPKWAKAVDVVLIDALQKKHPVGDVDFGPVLNMAT